MRYLQQILHNNILVSVDRIDEDWPTEVLIDELLEHFSIEVQNGRAWYKEIKPGVWHIP
jgi:hypothetical protein